MNAFARMKQGHLRRAILDLLAMDPAYTINEYILRDLLVDFSHKVSRDKLRTELSWLAEQGLVSVSDFSGMAMVVAKLSSRGRDVSEGAITVPGVKRPEPEDF